MYTYYNIRGYMRSCQADVMNPRTHRQVYMYICTDICIHTHMYTDISYYTWKYVHLSNIRLKHTHAKTSVYVHVHKNIYINTYVYMDICIFVDLHAPVEHMSSTHSCQQ